MSWLPKRRIVVPTDFTDESIAAVDTAMEIAEGASGIHIVHVLPDLVVMEPSIAWTALSDEDRIQSTEEQLKKTFSADKYRGMQFKVLVGDPGHSIADFAEEVGAELIVLPSHGRTGLKRMLIGSVAERVVRLAHCPVLVIRQ